MVVVKEVSSNFGERLPAHTDTLEYQEMKPDKEVVCSTVELKQWRAGEEQAWWR